MNDQPCFPPQPSETPTPPSPSQEPESPRTEHTQTIPPISQPDHESSMLSATPPSYIPVPSESLDRSKRPLLIVLCILLLVFILLVLGFFMLQMSATKAALTYDTAVDTYVKNIGQAIDSNQNGSGEQIKTAYDHITPPHLATIPFAVLSTKYHMAQTTASSLQQETKALTNELTTYATIDSFTTSYNNQVSTIENLSSSVDQTNPTAVTSFFSKSSTAISSLQSLLSRTTLPSDLHSSVVKLSDALIIESSALAKMQTALSSNNQTDYNTSLNTLLVTSDAEQTALDTISGYENNLQTQINTTLEHISHIANTLNS